MAETNNSVGECNVPPSIGDTGNQFASLPCSTETTKQYDAVSSGCGPLELIENVVRKASKRRDNGSPSALDVARYLIHLAACENEPEYLTHLRIHKLLYYVQGWSLALRGKAMFQDRIEAWAHGPVVPSVYPIFADFGDRPIAPENMLIPRGLSDDDKELIESVWESYKAYSSSSLRAMTHKEAPWKDARGKCAPADRCTTEITKTALKRYFTQFAK